MGETGAHHHLRELEHLRKQGGASWARCGAFQILRAVFTRQPPHAATKQGLDRPVCDELPHGDLRWVGTAGVCTKCRCAAKWEGEDSPPGTLRPGPQREVVCPTLPWRTSSARLWERPCKTSGPRSVPGTALPPQVTSDGTRQRGLHTSPRPHSNNTTTQVHRKRKSLRRWQVQWQVQNGHSNGAPSAPNGGILLALASELRFSNRSARSWATFAVREASPLALRTSARISASQQ